MGSTVVCRVAGNHNSVYEAYFSQVEHSSDGTIGALQAAKFLKKSGLSDVVLSRVWSLADPAGKGFLNKDGFFVALKLVALAQSGIDVNMVNITMDTPPPKMGDILPASTIHNNLMSPPVMNSSVSLSDWAVKPAEKAKYDKLFDSLQPLNGMIPGNKVKGVLMDSKLPLETLGKIWDLADMDKDGMLDRHEFMVAMHLVYKALEKYTIPSSLPPELMPPSKRKDMMPAVSMSNVPNLGTGGDSKSILPGAPSVPWVVTVEEKTKYDTLFEQTDIDKDGFVSGLEIKDVFLQSGVPQPVLAHIWSLCDIKQCGKLNSEQFALAMWLINQKLQGISPPATLTPEMIPPCFRTKQPVDGLVENNNAPYSNPELDMITKDIEELAKEKHILETDIAQKEADIKIKNGEIKSLQSELDTLAATLKQLENQKGEAQKRLNDLKSQKTSVEKELNDIKQALEEEQAQVDNLRRQADEQEMSLKAQEEELNSKKQELEGLKQEEARLEQQQKDSRNQLDNLTKNLQDTQLQISQVKAKITHLQEQHRQMNDAIAMYDTAITAGDTSTVVDTSLNIKPEFRDPEYLRICGGNDNSPVEQNKALTNNNDPFGGMNEHSENIGGFDGEDLFSNDPFKSTKPVPAVDPFSSSDPFSSAFPSKPADISVTDPFTSFGTPATSAKNDPFDPFGDGTNRNSSKSPVDMSGKDPFGCDPFALQPSPSGPPPRPESPSPALPPKKSKQPPPRPAPPRPLQQPGGRAAPVPPTPSPDPGRDPFSSPDPFAVPNSSSGSFANFADFDAKFLGAAEGTPVHSVKGVGKVSKKESSTTKDSTSSSSSQNRYAALEFTEDPFRNYRYEDPFNISDPFEDSTPNGMPSVSEKKLDPFGLEADALFVKDAGSTLSTVNGSNCAVDNIHGPKLASVPPEDQQLAWAAAESLKLENERRKRIEQEQADLEYALALSRGDKAKPKKVL
ncbi:epidermal growth factor receptor substrate 15-like 1 isoform X3 [Schistocerca gregaria]|uniref:epidermal growth factor receptor substrate 15-like 1 isoform X3 n=1 Tax=Schistocerca gregaria TaxID=7010 RepID=UPI00211F303E|nr:epidermal growth factor receptor substrate 15-like 1 isoform X3 [Schistocerca gregaria]